MGNPKKTFTIRVILSLQGFIVLMPFLLALVS